MQELLEKCPVCQHTQTQKYITCEDFTVSHEKFDIVSCQKCGFKFTNPRPTANTIGKYYQSENYISHSNTSKGIISKIYHQVRKITLQQKVDLINKLNGGKQGSLLDIGCGTGMFLNAAKTNGWKVSGVEPSDGARTMAEEINQISIPSEILGSYKDQQFDIITMWHVLEHVHLLNETVEFLKDKSTPNGKVIIAVPNHESQDAQIYQEHWAAYDVPRHLYHFSRNSIQQLFENHGFKLKEHLPMKFDSFYVSMLSTKYQQGNTNYVESFLSGLKSNRVGAKQNNNYSSIIYIFEKK